MKKMEAIAITLPDLFLLFLFVIVVYCWSKYSVFKRAHSLIILIMISMQFILQLYLSISNHFLPESIKSYNQFTLNIVYLLLSTFMILFYYYTIIKPKNHKKFQLGLLILYIFFILSSIFHYTFQELKEFQITLFLIADLFIFLSITNFFTNFIEGSEIVSLKGYLPFWISIALFLAYIGVIPVLTMGNILSTTWYHLLYYGIQVIAYLILIFGLNQNKPHHATGV